MILSYGYRKYMKTNRSRTYTLFFFFFFKQKTAYEIVSGDWSSTCALPISRDDQVRRELRCLERLRGFERLKGHGTPRVMCSLILRPRSRREREAGRGSIYQLIADETPLGTVGRISR